MRSTSFLPRASLLHLLPRAGDRIDELAGILGDDVPALLLDRLFVDKLAPHGNRSGAGPEEIRRVLEADAARRDHLNLRERGLERLDVVWTAHGPAREDFHKIRARLPRGEDFRGRQARGDRDLA